jgi:SNF2 family DNA or RNA helicase
MRYVPHEYQKTAIQHILDNPNAGLFAEVGRGKSSITLTVLEHLMAIIEIKKPLIVAPKRVASSTWKNEINKWDHTKHFKLSRIIGTPKQRIVALMTKADVYTISRDNIAWLVSYCASVLKKWPFDMVILDESSNFRNRDAMRYKAIRKIMPRISRQIHLTGTPFTKTLEGIWGQMYLLDSGQRLGKTLTGFRDQYMIKNYNGFGYSARPGAIEQVAELIKDICMSIQNADFDDVPERIDINEYIELENMAAYEEFKKTEVLPLANGIEITPVNMGGLYNKLLQFSNGSVYDADGNYHIVDDTKLNALIEEIEALDGQPVFIAYMFKSDLDRIKKAFPTVVKLETDEQIDAFNRGEIPILVSHPSANAYGLNLQEACHHMIWYGLPWDLELYIQFVGRVCRQGQRFRVINKRLIGRGTVEELVLQRLESNDINQNTLMEALKRYLN